MKSALIADLPANPHCFIRGTDTLKLLQNVALAVFAEPSPEDAAQVCLDEVCRYNHWPAGHLYLRAKDNPDLLKPTAAWYLEDEHALAACREVIFSQDLSIGHGLPGRALKTGKPCWSTDLAADTAPGAASMADLGITANLAFPVSAGREVLGVMVFYARLTEAPHHALIEPVDAVATLLGRAIAQHRTAQALRESDTRLAGLLEFAQDAIISTDERGRITLFNRGAEAIFGHAREEIIGRNLEMLLPAPMRTAHAGHLAAFAAGDATARKMNERGEIFGMRKNGEQFPAEASISKLEHMDGTVFTAILRDVSDRKRAETALTESEERFRNLVEGSLQGIVIHRDFKPVFVNRSAADIFGYDSPEEMLALDSLRPLMLPDQPHPVAPGRGDAERSKGLEAQGEYCGVRKDGLRIRYQAGLREVDWEGAAATQATVVDITERSALEERLRQAQKMEAVGQLAGGIAHDFNNMLQVIRGFTTLATTELDGDSGKVALYLGKVEQAAAGAASLTRQLLAYSRRQVLQSRPLDVNRLIVDLVKMVQRLIGEDIELELNPGAGVQNIFADRSMIEHVLINLCVNARDAMPDGGRLSIATQNCVLDEAFTAAHDWAAAGTYTLIEVSDNGCGMSQDVQGHIFEPFFTTKQPGEGTGLGLSMVYGIAKQHGGMIDVRSEVGAGTTFSVYLPITDEEAAEPGSEATRPTAGGNETILVAEDEPKVLELTKELLETQGYNVLCARDGAEAVQVYDTHSGEIGLVILDVVMPRMGGRKVFSAIRKIDSTVPVMFCTGYSSTAVDSEFITAHQLRMIYKPISPNEFIAAVRETLDGAAPHPAEPR